MSDDYDGLLAGGEIASTFDKPEAVKLGSCKLIEEIMIGEDKLIHFSGVEMGEACTIILRGASEPHTHAAVQGQCLPAESAGCCSNHVASTTSCMTLIGFFHLTLPLWAQHCSPKSCVINVVDWSVLT